MKLFIVTCLALVLCGASLGFETEEDTVFAPEAALTDLDNAEEELAEGLQDEGEDLEAASEADDDIETAIEAFVKASAQDGYEVFDEAHAIAMLYGDPEPDENEVEILAGNCRACPGATKCKCFCKKFKFWKKYKACAAVYYHSGKIGIRAKLNNETFFHKIWSLRSIGSGTIEKCFKKNLYSFKHRGEVCAGLSNIKLRLGQKSISARVHVEWWKIKINSSEFTLSW